MSDFLENLKKAADEGTFNSDAAKKINGINELAEEKSNMDTSQLEGLVEERLEKDRELSPPIAVTEEEALELNSQYEQKMEALKKLDAETRKKAIAETAKTQLKTLIEIEDMVELTIGDMMMHIVSLEENFGAELKAETSGYAELSAKMKELKAKYNS
jgi:hypothetical protein